MDGEIVAVVLCLFGSAFFSASETALTALPIARLEARRKEGGRLTRAGLNRWAEAPQQVLISILVGNNLVNVLASALATRLAYRLSEEMGLAIVVGGMTLVILIFGEITPKTLAQAHAELISVRVAPVLFLLDRALSPITWCLGLTTRILPSRPSSEAPVTEQDLLFMLRLAHRHAQLPRDARLMIESVLRFQRTVARELMIPRPRVATVDTSWSREDVLKFVSSSVHSRFPVVDGAPDNLIGILHSRHLTRLRAGENWHDVVASPLFIPESKGLPDLLNELRHTGQHLAIVLDEFGGLSGVISLEDVLELLVGEIEDEFDHEAQPGIVEVDGGWRVPGHLGIRRLERVTQREIAPPEGIDSIGGLVSSLIDDPEIGASVEWDGLTMTVLKVTDGRPTLLQVNAKAAPTD